MLYNNDNYMHYKLLNDQSKTVNGPWLMAGKSILNIFV